jgi:hypothetical protein
MPSLRRRAAVLLSDKRPSHSCVPATRCGSLRGFPFAGDWPCCPIPFIAYISKIRPTKVGPPIISFYAAFLARFRSGLASTESSHA